jgi:hypothetical protein
MMQQKFPEASDWQNELKDVEMACKGNEESEDMYRLSFYT